MSYAIKYFYGPEYREQGGMTVTNTLDSALAFVSRNKDNWRTCTKKEEIPYGVSISNNDKEIMYIPLFYTNSVSEDE